MKEKILALLKTKFVGVPDAILERIATKKAETTTTEGQATTLVEGLTLQNLFESHGDFRATEATQSAVSNYESKYKIKDGKLVGGENGAEKEPKVEPENIVEIVAKAVADAVKPFAEKVQSYELNDKEAKRNADIITKAKEYGIPEVFALKLKIGENDDLDNFMKGTKQDFANIGFEGNKLPETSEQQIAKEGESIAAMINIGTKEIIDNQKK